MIEGLERFEVFQGLRAEELEPIAKLCTVTKLKRGDGVFQAGEHADALFLVRAGTIELRFEASHSNATVEIPLEITMRGEIFGWSAVTSPYKYTLSAYATEDSELVRIKHADLRSLCEANSHLGYIFMKNIARVIGKRFQIAQQMLVKEIQDGLKQKDPLA